MKPKTLLLALLALLVLPATALMAGIPPPGPAPVKGSSIEPGHKILAGKILLKWGGYAEKVGGQDYKAWAASMWPMLAVADADKLQKALRAVTYEGMRNALLGQRPDDDQVIDRMARSADHGAGTKALGSLAADLVYTPILPCRIVDTRVVGAPFVVPVRDRGEGRDTDAANPGGNFLTQGGSNTDCGIPANPAALALSVTGLNNTSTGYLRVYPWNGTSAQGSPVPLNTLNTTTTNDMIVPTFQGGSSELKVYSTANTHYAIFVTGYFMAPTASPQDCKVSSTTGVVPASASAYTTPPVQCPAGYRPTGGDCAWSSDSLLKKGGAPYPLQSGQVPTGWVCLFKNNAAASLAYEIYAVCCRNPGR